MKLNRKWILVMSLVLSLTMATSGTLAYLTDRDTVENTFTMGNVDIKVEEDFPEGGAPIKPGQEVNKNAKITNKGANPAWVWMTVSVPEGLKDYVTLNWADGFTHTSDSPVVENGQAVWTVLVNDQLAAGASTAYILDSVTLSGYVDYQGGKYVVVKGGEVTDLEGIADGKMIVTVTGYATQVDELETVEEAYAAYQGQWGSTDPDTGNDRVTVDTSNIENTDFTAPNQTFTLTGEFEAVEIAELGEGSVLSFDNAAVGDLTISDDAVLEGTATINSINVVRNSTDPITVTLREANLDVANAINVKNTDGKSVLNIENSTIESGMIFVGENNSNYGNALAELNIKNSYVSCEENSLGSTIAVWGQSGVKATIHDSEIYTYSRGWHQSEDANDNSITFQGANTIDVDIQRSNMHLYGARSIVNARQYGNAETTVNANINESLIWVVTKSSHGEETLPVWGFTEIDDSILLFTKNVHQSTDAVFKSFVYGNPVIHGDYHVTTQCQWEAPIILADGQTVTFASDADVSIYEGAGNVEFVKNGSAKVVLESGASVTNIDGIN